MPSFTRRHVLASGAALTVIPLLGHAQTETESVLLFDSDVGAVTVRPVRHASFVLTAPRRVIYVDPVGGADLYAGLDRPNLILVTHEHGDHFDANTLAALMGSDTILITNPAVHAMLPADLQNRAQSLENGGFSGFLDVGITAVPAYNTTPERQRYHPPGRDNGYLLDFDGLRIYVSGDTEDTEEMRTLQNIDLAFVCMNLPFTMDAEAAASAVLDMMPKVVLPYHYRGRDDGTQDPEEFAALVAEGLEAATAAAEADAEVEVPGDITVRFGNWYG